MAHIDTIDLRTITERFEELSGWKRELEEAQAELESHQESDSQDEDSEQREKLEENVTMAESNFGEDEKQEYKEIEDLLDELRGNGGDHQYDGNWYPGMLIAEHDFTEYAQDLVEEIEDLPSGMPSYIVVDWEATANNLKADYATVEFKGTDYLYRA
jgi:phage-related minor tail protein